MGTKTLHVNKIQYTYTEETLPLFDSLASRQMGVETGLHEMMHETIDVYVLEGTGIRFGGRLVNETIVGTSGSDDLDAGDGRDAVLGSYGNDTIKGGQGADHLFGDDGNDNLYGGRGGDTLVGGLGANFLDGGDGSDVAAYLGSLSDYSIFESEGALHVQSTGSSAVSDTLVNVENLQFGYNVYTVAEALEGVDAPGMMSTRLMAINLMFWWTQPSQLNSLMALQIFRFPLILPLHCRAISILLR